MKLHTSAPLDLDTVLAPTWLSDTLSDLFPGIRVIKASVVESLTSVATTLRLRLECEEASGPRPDAICVKGYFAPHGRQMRHIGQTEAHFYAEIAPHLQISVPPCYYSAIDPATGHGLIIMRDMVDHGSRFLTALSPYSAEQVTATLDQLARLHVEGWNQGLHFAGKGWLDPRLRGFVGYVSAEKLQSLLDDGRGTSLQRGIRNAESLLRAFLALADYAERKPWTLVHCDAHAGNLYLDANHRPGIVDWQVVQRGLWALDVAYHISSVLTVEERERHEEALLAHYLEQLNTAGMQPIPWSDALETYKAAMIYGYFMWAITQRVERKIIDTMVSRLGAAVEYHDSFSRL